MDGPFCGYVYMAKNFADIIPNERLWVHPDAALSITERPSSGRRGSFSDKILDTVQYQSGIPPCFSCGRHQEYMHYRRLIWCTRQSSALHGGNIGAFSSMGSAPKIRIGDRQCGCIISEFVKNPGPKEPSLVLPP